MADEVIAAIQEDPAGAMASALAVASGVVLFVGPPDCGKTHLLGAVARASLERGRVTAIVDADIGQSEIGPPAAIGMTIFRSAPSRFRLRRPDAMAFVGSVQPFGFFLEIISGIVSMIAKARAGGAGLILVDTTSFVSTSAGVRLKEEMLLRSRPDHLVLLERGRELHSVAQLASACGFCTIHRMHPSLGAHVKPAALRKGHRRDRFAEYFRSAPVLSLELTHLGVHGSVLLTGRSLSAQARLRVAELLRVPVIRAEMAPGRLSIVTAVRPLGVNVDTVERRFSHLHVRVFTGAVLNGLIVGLEDSCGELLDLGIIQRCDFGVLALAVTSPFTDPAAVHLIRIGCLRLDRDGTDLGAIKPGEV